MTDTPPVLDEQAKFNALINDLLRSGREMEWIEFKVDNTDPREIGEYISALANSATINDQEWGYLVFGISDKPVEVVGTNFDPAAKVSGNQDINNWIATQLEPHINVTFVEGQYEGKKHMVVVKVEQSLVYPTKFKNTVYVRLGQVKKPIDKHPEKQKELWRKLSLKDFESQAASEPGTFDEAVQNISYSDVFRLLKQPLPENKEALIEKLLELGIIKKIDGLYSVTNLGAILFAFDLSKFEWLSRKAVRLVMYEGKSKTDPSKEIEGKLGYALGIPRLISYVQNSTQTNEIIGAPQREGGNIYPEAAVRELVVNALVHQDLSIRGVGPLIEVYQDRIEITNPGKPIIDTLRFVDHNPISRNEKLARLMRQMKFCEERGSGIDRAVISCELNGLPAPHFKTEDNYTRTTLTAPKKLAEMSKQERTWSIYIHACIQRVRGDYLTNRSVRELFKIEDSNYPYASRLIKQAIESGLIKEKDGGSDSRKDTKYVPFWS